jgi:hypothetical protein
MMGRASEDDRVLEGILELANVAGPVVNHDGVHRFRRQGLGLAATILGEILQEGVHEQKQVVLAVAQSGKFQRDNVEPVEEIGAEIPPPDFLLQVAIGGRDDANVHGDRLGGADRDDFTLLEHAEQLDLERRGHLATSSMKKVPLRAAAKSPCLSRTAPVNDPLVWPKSSLSSRVSGSAPQLIERNGPSARCERLWMYRATTSLPVPLSPWINTVDPVGATTSASLRTSRKRRDLPIGRLTWERSPRRRMSCLSCLFSYPERAKLAGPAEDGEQLVVGERFLDVVEGAWFTDWIAVWSDACAVIRMTGVSGSWSLAACRMSRPLTCGIRTSVRTMA